ncbi:hypothetical protein HOF54_03805 [Candidatus Woesearchaeota archaeon]|jgi:hypothetical protein|nr:hypothetical protein [Candidatus Woesearchaeota archaeon]MBT4150462.1 hypothetical protein [Candidatus Woesearchaeota archaeon]
MFEGNNKGVYLFVVVIFLAVFTVYVFSDVSITGAVIGVNEDSYSINVISGCNPDGADCTVTCDDLFIGLPVTSWGPDLGQCFEANTEGAFILGNADCGISPAATPGAGQCAEIATGSIALYQCPSYERNGDSAVVNGDCVCFEFDGPCGTASDFIDLSHEFFAGAGDGGTPFTFSLSQPANQSIRNNTVATYTITLTNDGTSQDNYTLTSLNIDDADFASINTTLIENISSAGASDILLIVGSYTPDNYSVMVNVTSEGNTSLSYNITIGTEVNPQLANVSISLVSPTGNANFTQNVLTNFTVNVSCDVVDCGEVNVSLERTSGCDPDILSCTNACDGLYSADTSGWVWDGAFACSASASDVIFVDSQCDIFLGAGTGQCALVAPVDDTYFCPSYERNSNSGVTSDDCGCQDGGSGCTGSSNATGFDLTHEFFASGNSAGLISNITGTSPFYLNSTNPSTITLNPSDSQLVTWYLNATADFASTLYPIFSFANTTTNTDISATTSPINLTITTPYAFSLSQPFNQSIINSSSASYSITLTNSGTNTDSYLVSVINSSNADIASSNVTTLTNVVGGGTSDIELTVASGVSNNYSVTLNVTSVGNNGNNLIIVGTEILPTPATIGINLVTPNTNVNFNKNLFTTFTVNVSCNDADCGEINVSLDSIFGCDPDTLSCTNACNDLFGFGSTEWANEIFGCASETKTVIIDGGCDGTPLGAGTGQCTNVLLGDDYYCPSYQRNGNDAVTASNCTCVEGDSGCATSAAAIFDLTNSFFAGGDEAVSKSGLVNGTIGANPYYVNSSNPSNVTLNSGESQLVSWNMNATADSSSNKHFFSAFANVTSNQSISATTSSINITIFESNITGVVGCGDYQGDSSACIAAGCTYDSYNNGCFPNQDNFDCNTFCDICVTEFACGASSKLCLWETEGPYGAFCHEDSASFEYGDGNGVLGDGGWMDAFPPDCINNPDQCDSSFDPGHNFVKQEYSCFDNVDNDVDGSTDCDDEDCFIDPACSNSYDPGSDTKSPQIKNSQVTTDYDHANIGFVATEPVLGEVIYYDLNSTCDEAQRNATLSSSNNHISTHFIYIDNTTIDSSLQNSTTYFYKMNITDQADNRYISSCLNFTTQSNQTELAFNFSGVTGYNMTVNLGAGFVDYDENTGLSLNSLKNVELGFNGITFTGVDFARAASFNFDNAFNSSKALAGDFAGRDFFSMNSSTWQQMQQQLGVDNFTMTLPSPGGNCDVVWKCNDDVSICFDVTNTVTCVPHNATHVNVTADSFSSYVSGSTAQLNITDDTDTTTKRVNTLIGFYANYTNSSDDTAITSSFTNAGCNITIADISVSNVSMEFNYSGDERWEYNTSAFTTAGTFTWDVNCSGTNFDSLNTTDTVVVTAAAAAATDTSDSSSSSSSGGGSLPPKKDEVLVEATLPNIGEQSQQLKSLPSSKNSEETAEEKKGGCPLGVGCAILDNFVGEGVSFTIVWVILFTLVLVVALGATIHRLHKKKLN